MRRSATSTCSSATSRRCPCARRPSRCSSTTRPSSTGSSGSSSMLGVDLQDPAARLRTQIAILLYRIERAAAATERLSGASTWASPTESTFWSRCATGPGSRPTCTSRGDRAASPPSWPGRRTARAGNPVWFAGDRAAVRGQRHGVRRPGHARPLRQRGRRRAVRARGAATATTRCEWIIGQPWSDGTLAVFGESYVGFTAIAAAVERPPGDPRGGAARHDHGHRRRLAPPPGRAPARVRRPLGARGLVRPRQPRARVRLDPPAARAPSCPPSSPDRRARRPRLAGRAATGRGALWHGRRRLAVADRQAARCPTHFTAGWWDLFHPRRAARLGAPRATRAARAGSSWRRPTTPGTTGATGRRPTRSPTSTRSPAGCRRSSARELAFLRKHLLGVDDGTARAPVSWMLTHVGPQDVADLAAAGRRAAAPAPRRRRTGAPRARREASLSTRPDRIPVEARWRHDPRTSCPSLEGEAVDGWFRPPDERLTQVRDDVLTFTSERSPRTARPRRSDHGRPASCSRRPPAAT